MGSHEEQAQRIAMLQGLMERLCEPNLTLGDSKVLRSRLSVFLERDDRHPEPVRSHSAEPGLAFEDPFAQGEWKQEPSPCGAF